LGLVDYREGTYASARAHLVAALEEQREFDAMTMTVSYIANIAALAVRLGQPACGARLSGAMSTLSDSLRIPPIPIVEAIFRPAIDHAREVLGDVAFTAEQQAGRGMSLDGIIALTQTIDVSALPALAEESAHPPRRDSGASAALPDGLTAREIEVLKLMAAGATRGEIATALVISVHTVETHITHVYQKIGGRNRADATAYALRHGLA
jgi:DNA-binding CsgD family transcriptional regulator